jgi:hypothetical protein
MDVLDQGRQAENEFRSGPETRRNVYPRALNMSLGRFRREVTDQLGKAWACPSSRGCAETVAAEGGFGALVSDISRVWR